MNNSLLKVVILSVGIAIVNLVFTTSIYAQDHKLKFGLAAGPSINWLKIKTEGLESDKTTVSFNYGLYADFKLEGNDNYYISSGIMIQSYNYNLNYASAILNTVSTLTASSVENDLGLSYLEIPLGVKMRSDEIGYSHIAGWFGFGTGFRINSSQNKTESWLEAGSVKRIETKINDVKVLSQGAKLSLKIGGEWERKITGETFFVLGCAFENGLTNILKGESYAVNSNGKTDLSQTNAVLAKTGEGYMALPRSIVIHLGVYF